MNVKPTTVNDVMTRVVWLYSRAHHLKHRTIPRNPLTQVSMCSIHRNLATWIVGDSTQSTIPSRSFRTRLFSISVWSMPILRTIQSPTLDKSCHRHMKK